MGISIGSGGKSSSSYGVIDLARHIGTIPRGFPRYSWSEIQFPRLKGKSEKSATTTFQSIVESQIFRSYVIERRVAQIDVEAVLHEFATVENETSRPFGQVFVEFAVVFVTGVVENPRSFHASVFPITLIGVGRRVVIKGTLEKRVVLPVCITLTDL